MKAHLPAIDGGALCGAQGASVFAAGMHYGERGACLFDIDGKPTEGCKGCLGIAVSAAVLKWRSIQEKDDDRARETELRTVETIHRADRREHAITQRLYRHYLPGLYRRRRHRERRAGPYQWALGPQS